MTGQIQRYYNVFDAILDISEQSGLDVEDIVKSLDENLLCELKAYSIKERKVLLKDKTKYIRH